MDLFNVGALELIFLLGLTIIIVGPQRAIELASQVGRIVASIRRNLNMLQEDLRAQISEETKSLQDVQRSLRELGSSMDAGDTVANGAGNATPPPATEGSSESTASDEPSPSSSSEERED